MFASRFCALTASFHDPHWEGNDMPGSGTQKLFPRLLWNPVTVLLFFCDASPNAAATPTVTTAAPPNTVAVIVRDVQNGLGSSARGAGGGCASLATGAAPGVTVATGAGTAGASATKLT